MYSYDYLVKIHIKTRNGLGANWDRRMIRALSWIERAEKESNDPNAAFMFLWVAFNAAYGRNIIDDAEPPREKEQQEAYFEKIARHDDNMLIAKAFSQISTEIDGIFSLKVLVKSFWYKNAKNSDSSSWSNKNKWDEKGFNKAIDDGKIIEALALVFERLRMLRNQLFHGGTTFREAGIARPQIPNGCAIVRILIPLFIYIMLNNPSEYQDIVPYPVVSGDGSA